MNKDTILGIIRHVFTFIGGIVVAKGYMDDASYLELSGAIITLIGAVWSVIEKRKPKTA